MSIQEKTENFVHKTFVVSICYQMAKRGNDMDLPFRVAKIPIKQRKSADSRTGNAFCRKIDGAVAPDGADKLGGVYRGQGGIHGARHHDGKAPRWRFLDLLAFR